MSHPSEHSIEIRRVSSPRKHPADSELGFGRIFTDHMFMMDWEPAAGWHRPRIVPYGPLNLDPSASVLHYGQAMFEGMKAFRGRDGRVRMFRPDRHCLRFSQGAPRLCMPPVDPELMQHALKTLLAVDEEWVPRSPGTALYIRPTLIATEPVLGVRASQRYLCFIILSPVGPYYADGWKPLQIWIEGRYVRAARGGLGAVKASANYVASMLAAEEARKRGYAQVLWLDAGGQHSFEEVGTMNVFVRIGDEVITPPLAGTILGGVTRESVITLLQGWGVTVRERRLTLEEVVAAHEAGTLKEAFGCGTASVIAPIGEFGNEDLKLVIQDGQPGELSRRIYDTIMGIQYGALPDAHSWMVEVGATAQQASAAPLKASARGVA
jgi:branched-chain amino acid aminotransferase